MLGKGVVGGWGGRKNFKELWRGVWRPPRLKTIKQVVREGAFKALKCQNIVTLYRGKI